MWAHVVGGESGPLVQTVLGASFSRRQCRGWGMWQQQAKAPDTSLSVYFWWKECPGAFGGSGQIVCGGGFVNALGAHCELWL